MPDLTLSLVGVLVALSHQVWGQTMDAELVATRQLNGLVPVKNKTDVCLRAVNRKVICLDTPSGPVEQVVGFDLNQCNCEGILLAL